jgi:hypothetical protein
MFKLFRRPEPPPAPKPRKPAPPLVADPLPVPEVVEDHDESVWSQWEQSQFELDSQMGFLDPADAVKVRDDGARKRGQDPEVDPFASVRPKDR